MTILNETIEKVVIGTHTDYVFQRGWDWCISNHPVVGRMSDYLVGWCWNCGTTFQIPSSHFPLQCLGCDIKLVHPFARTADCEELPL